MSAPADETEKKGCCGKSAVTKEDKKKAQEATDKANSNYTPSGAGRLPGSRNSLSEVEVNACEDQGKLEQLLEGAKKDSEVSGKCCGCCCGSKSFVSEWKWLDFKDTKELEEIVTKRAKKEAAAQGGCCGGKPDAKKPDPEKQALVGGDAATPDPAAPGSAEDLHCRYLGEQAKQGAPNWEPPNPNYFDGSDKVMTLLHLNRQWILDKMAQEEEDSLPFGSEGMADGEVEYIKNDSDEKVDKMSLGDIKAELNKRGHIRPGANGYRIKWDNNGKYLDLYVKKDAVVHGHEGGDDGFLAKVIDVCTNDYTSKAGGTKTAAGVLQAHAFLGMAKPDVAKYSDGSETDGAGKSWKDEFDKASWPETPTKGLKKIKGVARGCFRDKSFDTFDELKLKAFLKLCAEDPRYHEGQPITMPSFYTRSCQNCYCTVLFWIYWMGMMALLGIAVATGDPYRLVRPIDYQAHSCFSDSYTTTAGKAQLYYPRLAEDAFNLYQDGANMDCQDTKEGCFYGICVNECPLRGSTVCSYEAQMQLDAIADPSLDCTTGAGMLANPSCAVRKEQENQLIEAGNGCWKVGMGQVEILRRCFPWELPEVKTTYSCAVIQADGTTLNRPIDTKSDKYGDVCSGGECNTGQIEAKVAQECRDGTVVKHSDSTERYTAGSGDLSGSMTSAFSYIQQIASDVKNGIAVVILLGPVAAGVCGFVFVFVMSWCAGLIVWSTIISVQMLLVLITVFAFWMAGFFESAIASLKTELELAANETAHGANESIANINLNEIAGGAQEFLENYNFFGDAETTGYSNETLWTIAAWVLLAVTILYLVAVCCVCKHIKVAIALVEETGKTLQTMKTLLLYPFFTYFWIAVVFCYCTVIALYIMSSTATIDDISSLLNTVSAFTNSTVSNENFTITNFDFGGLYSETQGALTTFVNTTAAADDGDRFSITSVEDNTAIKYMFLYHFFGFLWTSEFVTAIGMLTIAGAVASDYWVDTSINDNFKAQYPVSQAFGRTMRYHTGSAAYGSLIIAIIRMARYIMMYIDSKTQELQKNNTAVKVLMKVVHCCLWCLEKCVRYITMNAYIMIAIEGKGFCLSAWRSFKILFSNALRIATTQIIATIITILAQLFIVLGCTAGCVLILSEVEYFSEGEGYVENPLYPAILVFISSLFVSNCFMQVYTLAINTLLLSFCVDEDKYKKGLYKKKKDFNGEINGQMFCVLNKKAGLIALISGSAKDEMHEAEKAKAESDALAHGAQS